MHSALFLVFPSCLKYVGLLKDAWSIASMLSQSLMLLNMLNWILKDAFEDSLIVHSSKQWKCVALPFVRISKSLCCISLLSWFCDCVACRPNHIQDIEAVVVHCCVLVCCMLLCNCVVIVLLYVVVLLLSYCVLLLLSSIVCCLLLESYPRSRNGCRPLFPTNTEGGWAGESMLVLTKERTAARRPLMKVCD